MNINKLQKLTADMIKQERLSQNLSIEELSKYLGIKLILKKGRVHFNASFIYIFFSFSYPKNII